MKKSGKKFGAILALMLGVALGLAGCGEDAREETYDLKIIPKASWRK